MDYVIRDLDPGETEPPMCGSCGADAPDGVCGMACRGAHATAESIVRQSNAAPGTGGNVVAQRLRNMATLDVPAALAAALEVGALLARTDGTRRAAVVYLLNPPTTFCRRCGRPTPEDNSCGCRPRR